jgi:hypothetical protein
LGEGREKNSVETRLAASPSQHPASLLKLETWAASEKFAVIAIPQIAEEIDLPFSVREKFGVDLRLVESGHRTTIKTYGAGGEYEVASLE